MGPHVQRQPEPSEGDRLPRPSPETQQGIGPAKNQVEVGMANSDLEFLFHPKSIAIVGTPSDPSANQGAGVFLDALLEFDYKGHIYPVNPKISEIRGLRAYPDLMSLPQTPDHVICCIPASLVPQLIKDCASRGVKAMAMYTAGFSEAGEEGRKLEQELVRLAYQGGIRLIGPNCMGIYCPSTCLSYNPLLSREAGSVGLLCQSGGVSLGLSIMANFAGIYFSKVISYGNAADLNESDFMEYLAQDNETKLIGAYIEGVRDGQRFIETLTRAAKVKPVAILKGGRTKAGAKATASHTGSLAGDEEKWSAVCRQAGAVQVYSSEEMVDFFEICLHMKPLKGQRVGIIAWGGGPSVLATDDCESAGLVVPAFSAALCQEMRSFMFEPGSSVSNPVDSPVLANPSLLSRAIKTVADSREVDVLIMRLPFAVARPPFDLEVTVATLEAIIETSKSIDAAVAVVQPHGDPTESSGQFLGVQQRCAEANLSLFSTTRRAAQAIGRFAQSISYLEH